jgi:hypothetical protein
MKLTLMMAMILGTTVAFAKNDVNEFNKALIEDVKHDLKTDNDQNLKSKNSPMRGPASVETEPEETVITEDSKTDKKDRQLGTNKW